MASLYETVTVAVNPSIVTLEGFLSSNGFEEKPELVDELGVMLVDTYQVAMESSIGYSFADLDVVIGFRSNLVYFVVRQNGNFPVWDTEGTVRMMVDILR